jgi:hypothetical protein
MAVAAAVGTVTVVMTVAVGWPPQLHARQGAKQTVVLLAPRNRPAETQQTIRAVWAQLSDVNVDLRVERIASLPPSPDRQLAEARRVAGDQPALAVTWFDPVRQKLLILLPGPGGGRFVSRAVGEAGDAGRFEAMALILRTTLLARRAGRPVGKRLPPPRVRARDRARDRVRARDRPPARPPARKRHRPRCEQGSCPARPGHEPAWTRLEVAWAGDLFAPEALLATGLRVALEVRLHRQWSVFAAYRLEAPIDVEDDVATLELRRHPAEIGGRFWWRSGRFAVGGRLALGLEVLERRTTEPAAGLRPRDGTDLRFVVTPSVHVGVNPARRVWLLLELGVRIHVFNERYVARLPGGAEERLVTPLVTQPSLRLGILVDLF